MMINRVRESRTTAVDVPRPGADNRTATPKLAGGSPGAKADRIAQPGSLVADMVALGPPVDSAKVAAIKAAIAAGQYPVDPERIAAGMIALGFGPTE